MATVKEEGAVPDFLRMDQPISVGYPLTVV
jgi:hypothetical protein